LVQLLRPITRQKSESTHKMRRSNMEHLLALTTSGHGKLLTDPATGRRYADPAKWDLPVQKDIQAETSPV
jgi:hypothetical protein